MEGRKMASSWIIPCDMAIVECHFPCKCAEEHYQIHLSPAQICLSVLLLLQQLLH